MDLFLLLKYSWFTVYSKVIRLYICIYMWIYVCILVQILFHCGLWDIEYSSLCNRVGPCCLYKIILLCKELEATCKQLETILKKKKKEFHDEESVAHNTQQGICHKDKNWNPAWENWPRTHGGSFGTIVGKNILNRSDGKILVYELCVTMG